MKKIGMLVCCLLLMSGTLFAQESKGFNEATLRSRTAYSPETVAMMRVDKLMQSVELTQEEKDAVYALFEKEEKDASARREVEEAERAKKIEAMKARRAQSNADLKKIIGEEKFAKYEAVKVNDFKNRKLSDPRKQ